MLPYLEHSEGEGVSQVVMGGEQHFAVVSIQIHTGQQVQLWVHPVETPVRQVWEEEESENKTKEENKNEGVRGRQREREVIPREKA